nr:hypothetical protein [Bacillus wiedmannii]
MSPRASRASIACSERPSFTLFIALLREVSARSASSNLPYILLSCSAVVLVSLDIASNSARNIDVRFLAPSICISSFFFSAANLSVIVASCPIAAI